MRKLFFLIIYIGCLGNSEHISSGDPLSFPSRLRLANIINESYYND